MPRLARKGISLLEAVAGLAIVGMVAASAMAATAREMRTAARARRAIEVEALATARMDWMALVTDVQLQSLPDSVARGTFPEPLDDYRWRTSVEPVAQESGLYDVRVSVLWKEGGKDVSYDLRSRLYRRPVLTTRGR
jgi:type II secretory pathway pseudopilin PulG